MAASVATFNNTLSKIVYVLDDREIYNDIISEIDITVTDIIVDAPASFKTVWSSRFFWKNISNARQMSQGEQAQFTIYPDSAHLPFDSWTGDVEAYYRKGSPSEKIHISASVVSSTDESIIVNVLNNSGEDSWQSQYQTDVYVNARYTYQDLPVVSHEEIGIITWTVQAKDQTSIKKYGRRELPLTWPLGQTQQQQQSLVESYLERYKEPVAKPVVTIRGSTDALIEQILSRRISDKITIVADDIALTATDFFINYVGVDYSALGIIEATWILEQVRAMEAATLFTLDTSELDGPHILG